MPSRPFYVSSILQGHEAAMKRFYTQVPFADPPVLGTASGVHCDDGVWLFVGKNTLGEHCKPITGRPEHTDAVEHSGTWHMQVMGSKTWLVRPIADSTAWPAAIPDITQCRNAFQGADGQWRLSIEVEQGDLLFVNTRLWWHHTKLNPQDAPGMSVSYARDFYLCAQQKPGAVPKGNIDGLHAPHFFSQGDVVLSKQ